MIAFLLVRTSKLVTEEEPLVSMATLAQSDIDLWGLGFMFAVENVPASIGIVEVYHVVWPAGGQKEFTPIKMVDCDELLRGGAYAG